MTTRDLTDLSRRERQIMDLIYKHGEMSAIDLREKLPGDVTDSGVRTLLRVLVNKEYLQYKKQSHRFVYFPTIERKRAISSAVKHLKETFFESQPEELLSAFINNSDLKDDDYDRFIKMINEARKEGH